jgi:hypothetical protein
MELHIFAYCTYFAYDTYIVQVHLIWSEDAVNTDTTSVQRDRRQAKRGVQCITYSYRNRANLSGSTESTAYLPISTELPCRIISHLKALTPVVSTTSSRKCVMKRRTLARFHMLIRMPEKSQLDMTGCAEGSFWNQRSALRGTLSPVL